MCVLSDKGGKAAHGKYVMKNVVQTLAYPRSVVTTAKEGAVLVYAKTAT